MGARVARAGNGMTMPSWDFVDRKMSEQLLKVDGFRPYLKIKSGDGPVTMKGEELETWEDLLELIEDEDDSTMRTYAELVDSFGDELPELIERIKSARAAD